MSTGAIEHYVSQLFPRHNSQHRSANSNTAPSPSHTVPAAVAGQGHRPEPQALAQSEDPALAQALAALAARYRVELPAAAQHEIVVAAATTGAALATLRAGLYLNKVGVDVTAPALTALVAAQQLAPAPREAAGTDHGATVITHLNSATGSGVGTSGLGQLLERVMAQDGASSDVSSGFGDPSRNPRQGQHGQPRPGNADAVDSARARSHELLNLSDGGALRYRYATLPLLVAGKLVELDMALFQQKSSVSAAASPQRLSMSLNTNRLGAVRVVAQSLGSSLGITLASTSVRGVAALTAALSPIRERLAALGWQVDGLRCELVAEVPAAGREIIDHVLTSGSLDRAL
jgi:hypothetical protein